MRPLASGAGDAFLCDGKFTATAGRKASVEIDTAKLRIKGLHNAYNAMAAALATLAAGVAPAKIRRPLYDFAPVEHRLEPVAEGGVLWINDSKATNVDSVYYALESMTRPWCGSPAARTKATTTNPAGPAWAGWGSARWFAWGRDTPLARRDRWFPR